MSFFKLFIWVFITYGFSNIVVHSTLFQPLRDKVTIYDEEDNPTNWFGKLINCMMCFPFHIGWFVSLILFYVNGNLLLSSPTSNLIILDNINITNKVVLVSLFFDGCLASGLNWLIHTIQEFFEK